jgi:hypothetical protein
LASKSARAVVWTFIMMQMRSSVDLAELPYVFSQVPLLVAEEFAKQASERGIVVTEQQLEALHQLRLMTPLLRVARSGRVLTSTVRRQGQWAWQMAYWRPTSPADIVDAHAANLLHDPAAERFIGSRRRQRDIGGRRYATSVYLYSHHQMIYLPLVREVLPFIRYGGPGDPETPRLKVARPRNEMWLKESNDLRDVVIAATALEGPYWVSVLGSVRASNLDEVHRFEEWRQKRPIKQVLKWLGVDPRWLPDTASGLLRNANRIDPLGPWNELVPHASPERWTQLRGDARLAVDLRVTAELLLRYYEDLAKARQVRRLEEPKLRARGPFDGRLKRTRSVDQVLTDFGLSPHPRLVLVVEGDTEWLLVPRALQHVLIDMSEDVISIQNAVGVGADLGALMGFVAPRVIENKVEPRYLDLVRPATRVLVVFDAERPVADDAAREKRRQKWVDRILRAMPVEHRTETVRSQVDLLVSATTWNSKGESFEFAHFTDLQIARAIVSLPGHRRQPNVDAVRRRVAQTRENHANLKRLIPRGSKIRLAEALWPVLDDRIGRAIKKGSERGIPIVRVLDEAVALAYEFPRRGLVIGLRDGHEAVS